MSPFSNTGAGNANHSIRFIHNIFSYFLYLTTLIMTQLMYSFVNHTLRPSLPILIVYNHEHVSAKTDRVNHTVPLLAFLYNDCF